MKDILVGQENHHNSPMSVCLSLGSVAGTEPDQSSGDPAAGILSQHQPAGETTPGANAGSVPSQ